MGNNVQQILKERLAAEVDTRFGVELQDIVAETPPQAVLGDLAFTVAFDLARKARKAPRKIAEELAPVLRETEGVEHVDIAGAGYLNVFLARGPYLEAFCSGTYGESPPPTSRSGKVIVEHTNINPNKAAHIGHLRNAALGDTFVRVLRFCRETVEVQNYIDDTGVQVADVVVGFLDLAKKGLKEIRALAEQERFDYYCWNLYAKVTEYFAADPARAARREATLKAIEEGAQPEAAIGHEIATRIARCHLRTMERINVRYDLMPWEGDILRLHFWDHAFALMKDKRAVRLAQNGKNAGCWVMDLPEETDGGASEEKVIVRSNGTVTYVGKDIAYQLWKLGQLDLDFGYRRFYAYPKGETVWSTTSEPSEPGAPHFGNGTKVYNVIDTRQSYLQKIVQYGVSLIGSEETEGQSHHFSYEMVALTPATCRELGFKVSEQESKKAYVEVSGRKGLGVKADDLIDVLEKKALREVAERNPELSEEEQAELARTIARGALRYFMIKFAKNKVIAFDFSEALAFEGDTGPYLQYAMVRANKIIQKMGLEPELGPLTPPAELMDGRGWKELKKEEANELWSLAFTSTALPQVAEQVTRAEEPALLARFAFQLAQKFNAFYHQYPILRESDPTKKAMRLFVVQIFRRQMAAALQLLGVSVPARM
ncbi:MAG: arginine--tRNA ligase [Vicinamibacteria bacterium]